MENEKISPEERLFKVIQEEKNAPSEGENFEKRNNKMSLRGIQRFFFNLRTKAVAAQGSPRAIAVALPINFQEIDPKAINKALLVVLAVLMILVVYSAINKRSSVARIANAISSIKSQAIKRGEIETLKPVSFYEEEVKKRDIFQPMPRVQKEMVLPQKKQALEGLKEMAANLKLQGISWGNYPRVMIRNEKEDKMYFLRQEQMIGSTRIEVKTIFKDKIVISYEGEEMELL